jgi:hypothetical protein
MSQISYMSSNLFLTHVMYQISYTSSDLMTDHIHCYWFQLPLRASYLQSQSSLRNTHNAPCEGQNLHSSCKINTNVIVQIMKQFIANETQSIKWEIEMQAYFHLFLFFINNYLRNGRLHWYVLKIFFFIWKISMTWKTNWNISV